MSEPVSCEETLGSERAPGPREETTRGYVELNVLLSPLGDSLLQNLGQIMEALWTWFW